MAFYRLGKAVGAVRRQQQGDGGSRAQWRRGWPGEKGRRRKRARWRCEVAAKAVRGAEAVTSWPCDGSRGGDGVGVVTGGRKGKAGGEEDVFRERKRPDGKGKREFGRNF